MDKATTHRAGPRRVPMPSNFRRLVLLRERLPRPEDFYAAQGVELRGNGAWRDALCPFHQDTKPSLRVLFETGAFRCMVCGAKGGDVLAFYMLRYGVRFVAAAIALGAWGVAR